MGEVQAAVERLLRAIERGEGQQEAAEHVQRLTEQYEREAGGPERLENPTSENVEQAVHEAFERHLKDAEGSLDVGAADAAFKRLQEAVVRAGTLEKFEKASGAEIADEINRDTSF